MPRNAEVIVLNRMPLGSLPLMLGVSQAICMPSDTHSDSNRPDIKNSRGEVTVDQQRAIWKDNLAVAP
jgi:hypothetical protein